MSIHAADSDIIASGGESAAIRVCIFQEQGWCSPQGPITQAQ